jgi:iron complex transport system substrate-binding protein
MALKRISVIVWLAAAAFLVAACGGDGGSEGSGGGTTSESRTIEHAMGETEISGTPERVVVLDTGELDSAMTLGVKPVGAVEAVEGMGYPSYLEGTEEIENVGTIEQPNLERIASLNPDLILSSKLRHEQIYDQLSEIAPTVFTETTGVTWKENFEVHAEALNRVEEGDIVEEEYQARAEEFQQAIGDAPPEVSVVRFTPGDTRIYQKESFIGTVLEDTGLPRPPSQDVEDFAMMNVSAEAIPDMGGDVIFTTVYGDEQETALTEITSDPLWQQLEAVQQGRVYAVSDDLWMLGIGYTAANGVIDDLTRYLLGGEATTGTTTGTMSGTTTIGTSEATTGTPTEVTMESTS